MSSGRPPLLIVVWDTVADPDCEDHLRRIVEILFRIHKVELTNACSRHKMKVSAREMPMSPSN
jgi:hypothetical protein